MEQGILTPAQKAVIDLVAKEQNLTHFYLTGGTALAEYYLQHRTSDDLDFFALEKPDQLFLRAFAQKIKEINSFSTFRMEN